MKVEAKKQTNLMIGAMLLVAALADRLLDPGC